MNRHPTLAPVLALALALIAAPAAAQQGPPPGQEDPYAYATDHATGELANASDDPAGYLRAHASPAAVGNASGHALWWACWTAWYEAESAYPATICDDHFLPPVQEGPANQTAEPSEDGNASADEKAEQTVQDHVNDTRRTVDNASDAVSDTLDDPASAPEQLRDLIDAAVGYLQRTVERVRDLAEDLIGGVGAGVGAGIEAGHGSLTEGIHVAGDSVAAGLDAVAASTTAGGQALHDAGVSVSETISQLPDVLAGLLDGPADTGSSRQAQDRALGPGDPSDRLLEDLPEDLGTAVETR